ncbi:MAG: Fe-S cluster assembly protein SufD [Chloroflexota bacterium]|nr:Fe-S cluster assembly protein SufD [Chloroflexota bacterium]
MIATRQRRNMAGAPAYTREDVIALSEKYNEPSWLRESRLVAWDDFYAHLPMPDRKLEEWRRTDYRHIRWDEASKLPNGAQPALEQVPSEMLQPLIEGEQGGMIVFVNGKLVRSQFSDTLAAQGVIFSDLHTAARHHEALVRANLMTKAVKPSDGKFAALHAALWTHGVFVYVPRNKAIEEPLHVVMYNSRDGMTMGHMLVVLEENAQATVLVDYRSADGETHSSYVGATELLVGDAANLKYVGLQEWNRETFEFSHQRARVGRDGQLDWVIGTMGAEFVKAFIEVELDGQGAYGRVSGMFFADTTQTFDHDTQQNHNAPMTTSDLLFKGAAKDEGRTVWQGMIKSLPKMQKIDGFQASRNLLLSEDARMDGIPGLEIEADDVRCTHAATFGTLEEQSVFYLMSRGIPRADAELMVTEGFFDELLGRIPFERVRARLRAALDAKIVGHELDHRDDLEVWVD